MSSSRMTILVLLAACLASELNMVSVSGRYLPTRSQDDRLDRLRDLLKDLLESQSYKRQNEEEEVGGTGPVGFESPRSVNYKRETDSRRLFKHPTEILSPKSPVPFPI